MNEFSKEITVNAPGVISSFIFELFTPLTASFIWINYYNGRLKCILFGVLGFFISVILETLFLSFITYHIDKNSDIFYAFTGISPGVFEETGRYIFLKYLLSSDKNKNISVSYGIGHGGIECIIIGFSFLSYLFIKDKITEKGGLKESITFFTGVMSASERLFAFLLQISLSVIIYKAIKEKKFHFYIFGIIIHDMIDLIPFLKLKGILTSIPIIELIVCIYSLSVSILAYNLYIGLENEQEKIKFKKRFRKKHQY
jgi:uncharacterized membrane protein YhfC